MNVVQGRDFHELSLDGSILTIGNFDGCHRGHQQLLAQGGLLAANTGLPLAVLTFEPHPLSVVNPGKTPPRLITLGEKLTRLAAAGVDIAVVAESLPSLLSLEPEDFIRDVIVRRFRPSHVVEGPSFGFGRGRRGNVEMLGDLGTQHGFEVCVVGPVELEIESHECVLVSSSLIRDLIRQGKVHRAALCLGRPHAVSGRVVEGHGRGAGLGFPTINLEVDDVLVPSDGVYAGTARLDVDSRPAAISVGTSPTFEGGPPLTPRRLAGRRVRGPRQVEAFLLDYDGDLYGQTVRLEFLRWLRPKKKFPSPERLVEQMSRDVTEVRAHAKQAGVIADGEPAS